MGIAEREQATALRYTRVAIWLHWTIGLLIILNLFIGVFPGVVPGLSIPVHKSIGLTVLALSIVRLGWRLAHPAPPLPRDIPAWQRAASHASHWAFYFFMIALPLSGWFFSSAGEKRRPLDLFGLVDVPYLPVQGSPLGGPLHTAHVWMGYALIATLVLHVAAALKHHFIDRDAVLHRMVPAVPLPAGATTK